MMMMMTIRYLAGTYSASVIFSLIELKVSDNVYFGWRPYVARIILLLRNVAYNSLVT